jgi:ABC-type glutathione transport system ATPase component
MNAALKAEGVCVEFGARRAVDALSLELHPGETLGLVGESGSGKSTLARALLKLVPLAAGQVYWQGRQVTHLHGAALRAARRDVQIVFQHPRASLNPRLSIGAALAEASALLRPTATPEQVRTDCTGIIERVGLKAASLARYPHELSGGECQRIAVARCMLLQPKVLVCDEPVSSLDVSIQGQIINLLRDLQRESDLALLFISHNLAVVRHIAQRILVMQEGKVVEEGAGDALFSAPRHPYTRQLLSAVPRL